MKRSVLAAVSALVLLACDPGKKLLEQCDAAIAELPSEPPESGDTTMIPPHRAPWDAAYEACRALAESESKLADRGKTRMQEIHGKQDKIEAVLKKRREARWKDEQETRELIRAGSLRAARQVVTVKRHGFDKDSTCTGNGLPPYMKSYEGGTFEQDALVAEADGCSRQGVTHLPDTWFCCPDKQRSE